MSIDEGPFQNIIGVDPEVYDLTCELIVDASGGTVWQQGVPYSNAQCGTYCGPELGFDNRHGGYQMNRHQFWEGLGWETTPNPAVRLVGKTSGAVAVWPKHCAKKLLNCWPFNNYNNYCVNEGTSGDVYLGIDQGSTDEDDFVPRAGYFHLLRPVGTTLPWINGEKATMTVTFHESTLPDPGPYNILSAQPSRFFNDTVLNLDRPIPFSTDSALCLENAGPYTGMQRARYWGWDFQHTTYQITIVTPFVSTCTGTATRIFDQDFDGWAALVNRVFPHPPLPSCP